MYTVLRITGPPDQLTELLGVLEKRHPDLSPEIDRTKGLVCNLSQNPDNNSEHWIDVADALDRVSETIAEAEVGDISLLVETIFDFKELPGGGVAIDTLAISQMALAAMARIGADFEATVYRPVVDDKV